MLGIATAALMLAGCVTAQQPQPSLERAQGASIVFESIEGAPRDATARLLASLNDEARARQLVVMARSGQANYRLRGYLAPQADTAAVAWAWDIYDSDRHRVARVTGAEPGSGFDTALVSRIAGASLAQVAAAIAADRAPSASASATGAEPAVTLALALSGQ